ncbi:MAG: glycoside hydrolase family 88 protein [Saprospiraceae bacterium]|nr:glycoside hydrolase family 88 protein [Saprospiraceae bacterium]
MNYKCFRSVSTNNTLKGSLWVVLLASALLVSCGNTGLEDPKAKSADPLPEPVSISTSLPWSERMAQSIMARNKEAWMTDFREKPRWTYTNGLVLLAILKVGEQSGKAVYYDYAKSYADTMINANGEIRDYDMEDFNIDHINPGKLLFPLYKKTGDQRYRIALTTLRRQLDWQPRTSEGGFWHKLIYPWQMWLDGLYMGSPFYAEYAKTFGEPEVFDDVALQFQLMEKNALDPATGLLHHGWDESKIQQWADPVTGKSPSIWGRAMGWYAMALVDVIEYFPENHPAREDLLKKLRSTLDAALKYQDPASGLWYQVLDQGGRAGNFLEATVSSMFVYTMVKGYNQGYLPESYLEQARKSYRGLIDNLVEVEENGEVHIHKCCAVAGLGGKPYRTGTYDYYINEEVRSNDPKATGPFLLASLEFEKLEKLTQQ